MLVININVFERITGRTRVRSLVRVTYGGFKKKIHFESMRIATELISVIKV